MSISRAAKSKPPPWIPPGKNAFRERKTLAKNGEKKIPETSPKKGLDNAGEEKSQNKADDIDDDLSINLSSSSNIPTESDIHLVSIYREMKLLYLHFSSVKSSFISAHRLIDLQNIQDVNLKEILNEIGIYVKELNDLFDDLEFSVCALENTLDDGLKKLEFLKVYKCKESLLIKLLDMYEKLILVYQFVFEKLDFQELTSMLDSVTGKLKASEKKNISQDAIIKDLERRISIHESKTSTLDTYKTNLENSKADLEKQLAHKETQIKYLSDELMNVSGKQMKSDHEELLQIIEAIKSKAVSDKSMLKKAIKFQRSQLKENEEKFHKLAEELKEKDKMMLDLAAQRDQLKVQLTIVNNSVVQLKNQIEEIKIQNLKLENEVAEQKSSNKKELIEFQSTLEEKSLLLEKNLKAKKHLEKSIEELQNELDASNKQLSKLKHRRTSCSSESPKIQDPESIYEEMHRLATLLQGTKDAVEKLHESSFIAFGSGDHSADQSDWVQAQSEILDAVKETKKLLLELKDMYRGQRPEPKGAQISGKRDDLETQLKQLDQRYSSCLKENQLLKSEIDDLKNASSSNSTVQKTENYFTANIPRDNISRRLELELFKKNEEMLKLKYEFQQKERDLENQLRECRDKVKRLEIDHLKLTNLEEELKATKIELSLTQEKKDEETGRLLQRTKELQDSLDLKTAEKESLERYIQLLKTSYFNVFGGS